MQNKIFLFVFGISIYSFIVSAQSSMNTTEKIRIMIFINGNRGPKFEGVTTNNQLHFKDPTGYWYQYDDTIIKRFEPITPIYFDGHHPLSNSMHRTKFRFLKAYFLSRFCWFSKKSRWVLNQEFNPEGFQEREENGRIAGQKVMNYLDSIGLKNKEIQVDFVTHSMGYAYSLGLLEVIKPHVKLGKMLAIAPESGGYKGYNWNEFEEVWQYGSNYGEPDADVIYYQDGIAVQMPINGIDKLDKNKGGRIFIPKNWPKSQKGFLRSHHLNWFQWFYTIKPSDKGYFTR
jgi:hypothetical protein